MNITIKKNENHPNYEVFYNDIYVGQTNSDFIDDRVYHIMFDLESLTLLEGHAISDFFKLGYESFSLDFDKKKFKHLDWIEADEYSAWFRNDLDCHLSFRPNFLAWDKQISLLTLKDRLEQRLNNKNIQTDFTRDLIEEGFIITFKINSTSSIFEEYNRILNILDDECNEIFQRIGINENNELLSVFSFPPQTKQACEQYLIYFSKFLEDLGIDVMSKLDSQAITTFFTVTPKDSSEALLNIKTLLDIYLSIPQVIDSQNVNHNNLDISVQQLMSNVYHLKSQLLLANSIVQIKEATIESLKFTNLQQNLLINKINRNEEKTLDGLITIDQFEMKGFKINLAEIFRRLKRQFQK